MFGELVHFRRLLKLVKEIFPAWKKEQPAHVSCLSACVGPVPSHVYVCFCTRTIRNSTCAAVGDEGIDTATCVLVGGDVAARGRGGDAEARGCLRSAGTTTFCMRIPTTLPVEVRWPVDIIFAI